MSINLNHLILLFISLIYKLG